MTAHCRIARVRLKSGCIVERFPDAKSDDLQKRIIDHARKIAGNFKQGEMAGFIVMGWDREATYHLGYYNSASCVVGQTLWPSWVADALRRQMIENGEW